jgi:NADPH-dependent ferric siderophore reductase
MVAETLPAGARTDGRAGGSLVGLVFCRALVERIEQVTPNMRLIRLIGPDVTGLSWTPGQQVRVCVRDLSGAVLAGSLLLNMPRAVMRSYSVWKYDGGGLELCVLDHGDGPGARWARGLRPGDRVLFRKPQGSFVAVPGASYHLFAGEETASVAFGAMLRALPGDAAVYGAVEVAAPAFRLPLPRSAQLEWWYRGVESPVDSAALVAAIAELDLPPEPGVAYVAGEARTCHAVRNLLVRERGWPRRSVRVKPFWTPGKRGME